MSKQQFKQKFTANIETQEEKRKEKIEKAKERAEKMKNMKEYFTILEKNNIDPEDFMKNPWKYLNKSAILEENKKIAPKLSESGDSNGNEYNKEIADGL